MIGYELDGVLVSKLSFSSNASFVRKMQRDLPNSIFTPDGDYVIITGRLSDGADETSYWVTNKLHDNPPKKMYHDNSDEDDPEKYKAKIINQQGIEVYFESNYDQYEYLHKNCPKCAVIYFPGYIKSVMPISSNKEIQNSY